jgi:hypothetical protein
MHENSRFGFIAEDIADTSHMTKKMEHFSNQVALNYLST